LAQSFEGLGTRYLVALVWPFTGVGSHMVFPVCHFFELGIACLPADFACLSFSWMTADIHFLRFGYFCFFVLVSRDGHYLCLVYKVLLLTNNYLKKKEKKSPKYIHRTNPKHKNTEIELKKLVKNYYSWIKGRKIESIRACKRYKIEQGRYQCVC